MNIQNIGEFGLIDVLKKYTPISKAVIKGIGDDTAVLPYTKSKYLLFTTDMMAEGVHFTRRMKARDIGHKALACNISDIAAMGGLPTFAVVSLGVPKHLPVRFCEEMYKGIQLLAKDFGVSIVGGDTIKSDKIVINVALLGEVEQKYLVTAQWCQAWGLDFCNRRLGWFSKEWEALNLYPKGP